MLTSGSFPTFVEWSFLAVVFSVPLISLIFLKREQRIIAGGSYRKPITALFIAELWLWVIAACIIGFILLVYLGLYVFINAHGHATGNENVPLGAPLFVVGVEGILILVGLLLHWFMKHLMY